MNTQHTPGPWAILSPFNSHMVCDDNQQVVAVATNGNEEANARLIAAAPELLEALRNAVVLVHHMAHQQRTTEVDVAQAAACLPQIREAITKATSQP